MTNLLRPADYVAADRVPADQRYAYGDEPDQFADLFLPSSPPPNRGYPVVALLHGGCWQQQFGCEPLSALARDLTGAGLSVWNLEYARLGGRGGWPNTFLDVAAGVDYLREVADPEHLDLRRFIAVGHSAGGHLALWLAARAQLHGQSQLYFTNPLRPAAVVALAGIGDLEDAARRGICRGAPADLLDGDVDEHPERYAQGSPHKLLPLGVTQIHAVGEADPLVTPQHVAHCVAQARAAGDHVEHLIVPDAGHFEIVTPGSTAWATVRAAIIRAVPGA